MRFDNNKYSVAASAVGRPVEVHAYADRIVIRQDGRIVGEHTRSFGRGHPLASVGCLVLGLQCSWCPGSAPMPVITVLHACPPAISRKQSTM